MLCLWQPTFNQICGGAGRLNIDGRANPRNGSRNGQIISGDSRHRVTPPDVIDEPFIAIKFAERRAKSRARPHNRASDRRNVQ